MHPPPFTVRPDERCQRGLHLVYRVLDGMELEPAAFESALARAYDDCLVTRSEVWGARTVRRLVLQFRFEVRLGARDGEVSFMFRATSPEESRRHDRAALEQALAASVRARRDRAS